MQYEKLWKYLKGKILELDMINWDELYYGVTSHKFRL